MGSTSMMTSLGDIAAKDPLSNMVYQFFDKLGNILKQDFSQESIKFKVGQSPFGADDLRRATGGREPMFYDAYKEQEVKNGTWGNKDNPDDKGYVNSEPNHQIVIFQEGKKFAPKENNPNKDKPVFIIYTAKCASKGYEEYIVIKAEYERNGKTQEKTGFCKEKELGKWVEQIKDEWNIEDNIEPEMSDDMPDEETEASTKMTVTLQKVVGSSSYDINLVKINANYSLAEVSDDLDAILSDDTFVESIPDVETTYVVVQDEDGSLDVTETAEGITSVCDIYQQLLNDTSDVMDFIRRAEWGAKGAIRTELIGVIDSMWYCLDEIQRKLAQECIIQTGKVPVITHSNDATDIDSLTAIELAKAVQDKIKAYLSEFEIVYVNFSADLQAQFNISIDSIKSYTDYALDRIILQ